MNSKETEAISLAAEEPIASLDVHIKAEQPDFINDSPSETVSIKPEKEIPLDYSEEEECYSNEDGASVTETFASPPENQITINDLSEEERNNLRSIKRKIRAYLNNFPEELSDYSYARVKDCYNIVKVEEYALQIYEEIMCIDSVKTFENTAKQLISVGENIGCKAGYALEGFSREFQQNKEAMRSLKIVACEHSNLTAGSPILNLAIALGTSAMIFHNRKKEAKKEIENRNPVSTQVLKEFESL